MDPIDAWQETYERVAALVADLTPEQLAARVPACPAWTVQDLLGHVIGLEVDVVGGDEPDDHNNGWTQAQVDARRGRTSDDLLAEWRAVSGPLTTWMRAHGSRPLNDLVIHEQDLRGAVDRPGGRDGAGLAVVRERMADRFVAAVGDLPPIAWHGETWARTSGDGEPAVLLEASDFDLARALMSRRTADQLRSWVTRGDLTPYLDAFAGLGPLPEQPLPE